MRTALARTPSTSAMVLALAAFVIGVLSSCASGLSAASQHGTSTPMPTATSPAISTPTTRVPVLGPHTLTVLNDVAMDSPTDGWAVGNGILHYDGVRWTQISSPPNHTLVSIAMVSPTDGWAVGDTILHFDGHAWMEVGCPIACLLHGIVMASATDGWAIGVTTSSSSPPADLLLHFDGTKWRQAALPPHAGVLNGLSLDFAGKLWLVGEGNTSINDPETWRFDDANWSELPLPADTSPNYAIAMISPSDGWAIGGGDIAHFDGQSWRPVQTPANMFVSLSTLSMVSSTAGWAGGNGDELLHLSNGVWSAQTIQDCLLVASQAATTGIEAQTSTRLAGRPYLPRSGVGLILQSIKMLSEGDGWAVGTCFTPAGSRPFMYHYDGAQWDVVPATA